MLHGAETLDDAGVISVPGSDRALVQTLDFFPPIVDDPVDFGRIAAANALSDVYAMGADPFCALNLVGFPRSKLPMEVLGEILKGGAEKLAEAKAALLGGHSVEDSEIKYGLAVTGLVDPDRIVRNGGARPGDRLVLTKPLGMGAVSTAIQKRKGSAAEIAEAITTMATLNAAGALAMQAVDVHAGTDITGFGLMGHATEVAVASGATLVIDAGALPITPGARELARRGILSGGTRRNRRFLGSRIAIEAGVPEEIVSIIFDSETSGGLFIAVAEEEVDTLLTACREHGTRAAAVVGRVEAPTPGVTVRVTPGA